MITAKEARKISEQNKKNDRKIQKYFSNSEECEILLSVIDNHILESSRNGDTKINIKYSTKFSKELESFFLEFKNISFVSKAIEDYIKELYQNNGYNSIKVELSFYKEKTFNSFLEGKFNIAFCW